MIRLAEPVAPVEYLSAPAVLPSILIRLELYDLRRQPKTLGVRERIAGLEWELIARSWNA